MDARLLAGVDVPRRLFRCVSRDHALSDEKRSAASDATDDNDFVAPDDGRRRIDGQGRSSIRVDQRIHFDGTRYHLGDGSLALDVRILHALRNESMSRSTLAESLHVRKERVLTTVQTMIDQGLIRVDGSLSKLSLTLAGVDRLS